MSSYRKFNFHLVSLAIISATFLVDLCVPMGSLAGAFYAFAVLIASLGTSRSWVVGTAAIGISLAVAGALQRTSEPIGIYDCFTAVVSIVLMFPFAWLNCVRRLESFQRQRMVTRIEAMGCEMREIAHALSNVMQVVLGLSYMMQEDLDADDPRQGDFEMILTSVRNGSSLTERLSWLGHQAPRVAPPGIPKEIA